LTPAGRKTSSPPVTASPGWWQAAGNRLFGDSSQRGRPMVVSIAWYGWIALAVGLWGVVSVIAGLAAGRMIGEAASAGTAALATSAVTPAATPARSMASLSLSAH